MIKLRCPLCFWVRNADKNNPSFPEKQGNPQILLKIDVVGGGGGGAKKNKGVGFFINESESLTLNELKDDHKYADLIEQIRDKCKEILNELK